MAAPAPPRALSSGLALILKRSADEQATQGEPQGPLKPWVPAGRSARQSDPTKQQLDPLGPRAISPGPFSPRENDYYYLVAQPQRIVDQGPQLGGKQRASRQGAAPAKTRPLAAPLAQAVEAGRGRHSSVSPSWQHLPEQQPLRCSRKANVIQQPVHQPFPASSLAALGTTAGSRQPAGKGAARSRSPGPCALPGRPPSTATGVSGPAGAQIAARPAQGHVAKPGVPASGSGPPARPAIPYLNLHLALEAARPGHSSARAAAPRPGAARAFVHAGGPLEVAQLLQPGEAAWARGGGSARPSASGGGGTHSLLGLLSEAEASSVFVDRQALRASMAGTPPAPPAAADVDGPGGRHAIRDSPAAPQLGSALAHGQDGAVLREAAGPVGRAATGGQPTPDRESIWSSMSDGPARWQRGADEAAADDASVRAGPDAGAGPASARPAVSTGEGYSGPALSAAAGPSAPGTDAADMAHTRPAAAEAHGVTAVELSAPSPQPPLAADGAGALRGSVAAHRLPCRPGPLSGL
jgi:hypothetical protein